MKTKFNKGQAGQNSHDKTVDKHTNKHFGKDAKPTKGHVSDANC